MNECLATIAVWNIMEKPRNLFLSSSPEYEVGPSLLGRWGKGVDTMNKADKNIKGH